MMYLTGNIVDSKGNPFLTAYYYKSDINGAVLGPQVPCPYGTFIFQFDETDNNTYWRWGAPGFTIWQNQAFGNGGYLVAHNPFTVTMNTPDSQSAILPIAAGLLLLLTMKKKKTVGKLETADVMPYLIIGGAVLVLGGLNKLLQSLGIEQSPQAAALQNTSSDPGSPWNPNFFSKYSSYTNTIDATTASNDATTIYDAFGWFYYDIDKITAVIHSLTTQAELSYLAYIFNQQYSKDLFSFLYGSSWLSLTATEMSSLNSYINQLPTN